MSNVRLTRLQSDYDTIRRLVRKHPLIETEGVSGNPPEVYRLFLTVRSLQQRGQEIFFVDRHRLEITLPRGYPRDAPICRMLTPVFHPNIAPHAVCITDNWSAAESLSSVIMRVCEMLAFQSYNIKSPLNGEAAQWAAGHLQELPTDKREFFLDLDQTPDTTATQETVCSNCGGSATQLTRCDAGHGLCEYCFVECEKCHQGKICLVCSTCNQCGPSVCSNCAGKSETLTRCAAGHALCEYCLADCATCQAAKVCLVCGTCTQCPPAVVSQSELAY
ncbi:MAG TPA: ubiquitin-conjugating enzyme E2 [Pyrinomonadaceae bacterium]|nr:ubiquitin-conjugating enzyme E2 [Pyrinomonadaceae bacterium]